MIIYRWRIGITQNAGSERRSAGLDMTFSADKSVSALWAIADPELRSEIEKAHNDAARVALEETVLRHCAYTASGGRVAIIEGAAGSGKTTTLRPIADLYREHGIDIIATAVAWRTAVALGNDVEARPFCVDKLLRLAARGGIDIDGNTTIIVDEAGMLSTRQAHHILQLSRTPRSKDRLRGRHTTATTGGGGTGAEVDP